MPLKAAPPHIPASSLPASCGAIPSMILLNSSAPGVLSINSSLNCLEKQGGVKPAPNGTQMNHNSNRRYYHHKIGVVK